MQAKHFLIGWAGAKTLLAKIQTSIEVTITRRQSCQTIIAACFTIAAPDRPPEILFGLLILSLTFVSTGANQTGLSALRIFVQRMCAFQRLSGIRHRLREVGAVIFQHRQRQVTAIIQQVQRHAAQVVIEGGTAGMMILLQMLTDKPGFICTGNVLC